MDATDSEQLVSLAKRRYDASVSKMVIMDLPTLEPLLPEVITARARGPGNGAVVTLLGTTRRSTGDRDELRPLEPR